MENNNVEGTITNLGVNSVQNNTMGVSINPNPQSNIINDTPITNNNGVVNNSQQIVNQPTMNTDNNVTQGSAVQPVSNIPNTNNTAVQSTSNVVAQPVQNTVVQSQPVTNSAPIVENTQKEPIVSDKIVIEVEELQRLVSQAQKLAKDDNLLPVTQVYYIVINREGFTIFATNNEQTLEITSRVRSYTQTLKLSLNAEVFTKLVMALDKGLVEFIYNEEQSFVTLKTDTGAFQFPQTVDLSTQLQLSINPPVRAEENQMIKLDFNALLDTFAKSKPVRDLSRKSLDTYGTYFKDIIISSDSNLILMQKTLPELVNYEFYMPAEFIDLVLGLTFNPDKVRMGFTTVDIDGYTSEYIIFSDGDITISGRTMENKGLPIEICEDFWNTPFDTKIQVDTKKTVDVLRRIIPFISQNTDLEFVTFDIKGNLLQINSLNGQGRDLVVSITNPTNYTGALKLPAEKLLALLQVIVTPTFEMTINPARDNCICIEFSDYKCVVSVG